MRVLLELMNLKVLLVFIMHVLLESMNVDVSKIQVTLPVRVFFGLYSPLWHITRVTKGWSWEEQTIT